MQRISSRQFGWLIITILISTSTVVLPQMVISDAKQNAWLAVLLATLIDTLAIMLYLALTEQFPGQTVTQYAQTLLGSWMGKFVAMFYALTCLYIVATCIGLISQLIKISVMPETPLWPFVSGFVLLAVYSAWLGIEPIARANDLILPFIIVVFVVILLLAAPQGKLFQALPVLQLNSSGILRAAIPSLGCLGEVFVILLLAPAINKPAELKSTTLKAVLLSGLVLMLIAHAVLFVLGSYRASVYFFSLLRIAEELHVFEIFERFEPFVLTAWFTINCIKMSALLYCYAIATAQTINLKDYRKVLIPTLIVLPFFALAPRSLAQASQIWIELIAFKILIPLAFLILPGLLFIVAKVKKRYV